MKDNYSSEVVVRKKKIIHLTEYDIDILMGALASSKTAYKKMDLTGLVVDIAQLQSKIRKQTK